MENIQELKKARVIIDTFYQAIRRGESGLKNVPDLLIKIISENLWQSRMLKTGEVVNFENFRDFITTEPPEGLGETVEILRKICSENDKALQLLNDVTAKNMGGRGGNNNPDGLGGHTGKTCQVDDVNLTSPDSKGGNSQEYLLARIKRDAPDVLEDYANGKYPSVRAAAIDAGIIRIPSAHERAVKLLNKMKRLELMDLQARITAILQEQ